MVALFKNMDLQYYLILINYPHSSRQKERTMPDTASHNNHEFVDNASFGVISLDHHMELVESIGQFAGAQLIPELQRIRRIFTGSGLPMVSAHAVYAMSSLITKLHQMNDGDVLDHPWGFVHRVSDGFKLAYPRQSAAEGNWHSDNIEALANRMFEQYMLQRGISMY